MYVIAALIALGALVGCAGPGSAPSSSDSSNLLGTYTGILPCADCAGIRADLKLYAGQPGSEASRYEITETYIGTRVGDRTFGKSGRVKMVRGTASDKEATVYQLESDRADTRRAFLRAGDNELRLLDLEKRELASAAPHSLYRATTLAEGDSGKAIDVSQGERVIVRLSSNRTTGYRWSLLTSGSNALTSLAAAEYTQEAGADGKPGAGGAESWYFQASRSGQQELRFEYRRPWEVNVPAAKSTNYSVRVR
jgi:copper homeostasis protein (lipoprotein)